MGDNRRDSDRFNPHLTRRPGATRSRGSLRTRTPSFNPHPARRPGATRATTYESSSSAEKKYNALLEAWRNQWRWHQRGHAYDDVKLSDMYDDGRIAGSRFTLYKQFTEHRQNEQAGAGRDGVSWTDGTIGK